jgi:ADP-ribosylglycohydrolase
MTIILESKFLGGLVGTAIGDALGQPYEGFLRPQLDKIGNLKKNYRGRYTDDTQLTLAIANSLIEGGGYNRDILIQKFVDWLEEPPIGPGAGCLTGVYNLAKGVIKPSNSGGNGTAMRVSPIGYLYHRKEDLDLLKKYAIDSSVLTHDHWAASAGAITVARAVAYVLNHDEIDTRKFINTLAKFINEPEFKEFHEYLLELPDYFEMPVKDALRELGLKGVKSPFIEIFNTPYIKGKGVISGYTVPTVLSAIYTFLLTPNSYITSVEEVIRGAGDTDTTAAICGAISGAFNGIEEIPDILIDNLKDRDRIFSTAKKLYQVYTNKKA